tara:strand:+ start:1995 stop:2264 length:270 start_codon:yes stop_codon:yes gene_type:complete
MDDKEIEKQAAYYDSEESDKDFDDSKATYVKGKLKQISIDIPYDVFNDAEELGRVTGTGYENSLKTAMVIGLHNLKQQLSWRIEKSKME